MFSTLRKRARHPIRSITEPFGKAGLTVAIFALVLAMVGGAYAAGGLTKSQEKQVKKIAKKYAGKPGAPGTNGTNGTNGAPGEKGPKGDTGAAGESVTITPEGECTKFKNVSGEGEACNGLTGFISTLPSEKTETGSWAYSLVIEGNVSQVVPISFSIPLAKELEGSQVHYILANGEEWDFATQTGVTSSTCLGTVADPKALAGNLCVYAAELGPGYEAFQVSPPERIADPSGPVELGNNGAGKAGAVLDFELAKFELGYGTWAVTAE